jgi:hypothetical protein
VSRQPPTRSIQRPLTADELIEFWLAHGEPLSPPERGRVSRRGTPRVLVIARCVTGLIIATIVLAIGPLLRAVGGP